MSSQKDDSERLARDGSPLRKIEAIYKFLETIFKLRLGGELIGTPALHAQMNMNSLYKFLKRGNKDEDLSGHGRNRD